MASTISTPQNARTERTRRAYDRASRWYDFQEWLPERLAFRSWRRRLWGLVPDGSVLEIGVGTGKNLPYYGEGHSVTAIDLSPKMLTRAEANALRLGTQVDLRLMDAQSMEFIDGSFDSVVSTFVFCSVPDPVRGLRELGRVVKPDGVIMLLEHVWIDRMPLGRLMDALNPLIVRLWGANINRRTVENARAAGLRIESVESLGPMGMVKLIRARPAAPVRSA
jgi:ubiquinone/menaquinone biosynthesis C-methylase UbiE